MAKTLFEQLVDRSVTELNENELKGLNKIGSNALSGTLITNLKVPEGVTRLEEASLSQMASLKSVTIPDSVKYIGKSVFSTSAISSIPITNGVNYISERMYSSCLSLYNVIIPNNIVSIGNYAFSSCSYIDTITIPSGVHTIGEGAFQGGIMNMAIRNVYFQQPSGMAVTLPVAGSSTGMFYVKTARSMNIYTDNETIKNYAWSTDGITATFYHLDGTPW